MGFTILLRSCCRFPGIWTANFPRAWLNLAAVLLGAILMPPGHALGSGLRWKRLAWLGAVAAAVLAVRSDNPPRERRERDGNPETGLALGTVIQGWQPFARARLQNPPHRPRPRPPVPDLQYQFPQFLGPQRNGRKGPVWPGISGAPRLPVNFGDSGRIDGPGSWPPPAITQEQAAGDELVTARVLRTGTLVWSHTNLARFTEFLGGDGPRATPTIASNACTPSEPRESSIVRISPRVAGSGPWMSSRPTT
ncbi:MAG: hypothetical protein U1G08_15040 [Verrucomicrobiota bacterium]